MSTHLNLDSVSDKARLEGLVLVLQALMKAEKKRTVPVTNKPDAPPSPKVIWLKRDADGVPLPTGKKRRKRTSTNDRNVPNMNLADALGDGSGNNQAPGGAVWPGGNAQPQWPGGQPANPTWPGGQAGGQPQWPGGPSPNPTWPGQPSQPGAPGGWPGQPGQPSQPGAPGGWPGQPGQPSQPNAPGGWPGQPSQSNAPGGWPGQPGQPSAPGGWPGQPGQPNAPGGWPGQPGQPSAPGGWPGPAPGQGPMPVAPTAPQKSLAIPYEHTLRNGVYDKLLITICGNIKPNPDRFCMNFMTANGDIPLHFNPRFKEGGSRKVVVRNSCVAGRWAHEEREGSTFPFAAGQAFEIKVMCTSQEFKVAVNGSHLLAFKHRMHNLQSITRLSVAGDLTLSSVTDTRLP